MNCRQIKKQLSTYQDGELSAYEENHLKAHLRECESCRRFLHELEVSWDLLESLTGPEPVPYFYTRLQARIDGEKARPGWIERILVPVTVVGVVFLGVWMGSMVTRNGSTTVQQAAQEELIPSLQLIEQVEEFPEESFGKVYTELAVMR